MDDIQNVQARHDENKKNSCGMKGLVEDYDSHMLDVTRISEKSRGEIS